MSSDRKNSFVLYGDYSEHIELLNMEERGELFTAIFEYVNLGKTPEFNGMLKMAFSFIKSQLDRDKERYIEKCEKNKKIAIEREEKRKKQLLNVRERSCTLVTDNDNDNDTDTENENDTENDIYINKNNKWSDSSNPTENDSRIQEMSCGEESSLEIANNALCFYFSCYEQHTEQKHPFIKKQQLESIKEKLEIFVGEYNLTLEDIKKMIEYFFSHPPEDCDLNINAFVSRGIFVRVGYSLGAIAGHTDMI